MQGGIKSQKPLHAKLGVHETVEVVVVVMVSGLQDVGPIVTALAGSVMATYIVEVGMGGGDGG